MPIKNTDTYDAFLHSLYILEENKMEDNKSIEEMIEEIYNNEAEEPTFEKEVLGQIIDGKSYLLVDSESYDEWNENFCGFMKWIPKGLRLKLGETESNEGSKSKKKALIKQTIKGILKERHAETIKASEEKKRLKEEREAYDITGHSRIIINSNPRTPRTLKQRKEDYVAYLKKHKATLLEEPVIIIDDSFLNEIEEATKKEVEEDESTETDTLNF